MGVPFREIEGLGLSGDGDGFGIGLGEREAVAADCGAVAGGLAVAVEQGELGRWHFE